MREELRLPVLEPRPLTEHPRKRCLAVERIYPPKDLLVAEFFRLGNIDEDVKVIRHDRIRKNDHPAKFLHTTQKLNRARLLVIIEKEQSNSTLDVLTFRSITAGIYRLLLFSKDKHIISK